MRTRAALVSAACCLQSALAAAGQGLALPDEQTVWPQWHARLTVGSTQLAPVSLLDRQPATAGAAGPASGTTTSAVLGDYYFDAPGLRLPATLGGLRATSGLLQTGLRGPRLGDEPVDTQPYLGIGYTGLALKGGWGVTADLGLALENPAAARSLGRAVFGNQGFDSAWRDLRLSPVLQLGVRYAF